MAEVKKEIWAELRKPFDPKVVGKIPKGGIQLDYVGHAAVTDRLLEVDPEWTWEPLATSEQGLPILDADNNLWIKLTVGGVTRLGVGDGRNMKERIGDALRNAAMRYGVALDLWSKEELESHLDAPDKKNFKSTKQIEDNIIKTVNETQVDAETGEISEVLTKPQKDLVKSLLLKKGVKEAAVASTVITHFAPGKTKVDELTKTEASNLIEQLMASTSTEIQAIGVFGDEIETTR